MKYADSKESKENGTGESSRILYSLSHQGSLLRHTQRQNRSDYSVCWSVGMERPFSSVQFSHSVMSDFLRPHEMQHARPPCQSPIPGVHSNSSIRSVMPSSHLILCCPLLLLPLIPPSIRVFSNESALHMRWPKYWSFSFSIIPSRTRRIDLL